MFKYLVGAGLLGIGVVIGAKYNKKVMPVVDAGYTMSKAVVEKVKEVASKKD